MKHIIKKTDKKILCVDLDGVLAELNLVKGTDIGKPIGDAMPILKKFKRADWYIVLYTVRPDEWLLRKWCDKHYPKIFDAINCNPLDVLDTGIVAAKPYADLYLDDRAWPNWGKFNWQDFEADCIRRGIIS